MWRDVAVRWFPPRPGLLLRAALSALLLGLVLSGAAHAWAGIDLLDHLHLLPGCAFRGITGFPCPGCGMTRALLLLSQLRVGEAVAAHPLAPVVVVVIALCRFDPPAWNRIAPATLSGAGLAATLGVWIWRLSTGTAV